MNFSCFVSGFFTTLEFELHFATQIWMFYEFQSFKRTFSCSTFFPSQQFACVLPTINFIIFNWMELRKMISLYISLKCASNSEEKQKFMNFQFDSKCLFKLFFQQHLTARIFPWIIWDLNFMRCDLWAHWKVRRFPMQTKIESKA